MTEFKNTCERLSAPQIPSFGGGNARTYLNKGAEG